MQNFFKGVDLIDLQPGHGLDGGRLLSFRELESTNSWAIQHPEALQPGDVIWTTRQTAGRGRLDRTWMAPEGKSLTFSIFLDPSRYGLEPALLGQLAALGLARFLNGMNIAAHLKWPNDILVRDHKIAGILLESTPGLKHLVLGIGLNVNLDPEDLPPTQLRSPATSLKQICGQPFELAPLLHRLIRTLDETFQHPITPLDLRHQWDKLDALRGLRVTLESGPETFSGLYRGIDLEGRILLELGEKELRAFWSGDVDRIRGVKPR